jgi:hypothetical protein
MIRDKEKEELKEIAMKIKELMKDVSEDDWVRAVRESRDERLKKFYLMHSFLLILSLLN